MTIPHPDETQALIAKLRLFGNNIPDSENVETELDNIAYRETFLKAADALEAMWADDPETCLEHCTEYVDAAAKLNEALS